LEALSCENLSRLVNLLLPAVVVLLKPGFQFVERLIKSLQVLVDLPLEAPVEVFGRHQTEGKLFPRAIDGVGDGRAQALDNFCF